MLNVSSNISISTSDRDSLDSASRKKLLQNEYMVHSDAIIISGIDMCFIDIDMDIFILK